jgi:hypothetical protein
LTTVKVAVTVPFLPTLLVADRPLTLTASPAPSSWNARVIQLPATVLAVASHRPLARAWKARTR